MHGVQSPSTTRLPSPKFKLDDKSKTGVGVRISIRIHQFDPLTLVKVFLKGIFYFFCIHKTSPSLFIRREHSGFLPWQPSHTWGKGKGQ